MPVNQLICQRARVLPPDKQNELRQLALRTIWQDTAMTLWLTLLAMGLVTFATRLSFITALEKVAVPPLIRRGLRFVPPAVLSAIILPVLLRPAGALDLSFNNAYLLAGLLAIGLAWRAQRPPHHCGGHVGLVAVKVDQPLKAVLRRWRRGAQMTTPPQRGASRPHRRP
jgi:branched-subunit amino acid transport protein